eukprot:TRINITY_DN6025_c0_g1_i1.p2 TRINITY_DN6025_c0_g1~~TRINITY_DN6025_c0_g1_i1.p2  ORF type:complete len:114 (+),score=69.13 TRINITY_DN6025_c0_g1_i1:51-392(+)
MSMLASLATLGGGFLFPAYKTIQSLEANDKKEQDRLLKYWSVFGLFYFVTSLLEVVLALFPLYYYFHTFFVVLLATQDVVLDFMFQQLSTNFEPVKEQLQSKYDELMKKMKSN